MDLLSLDKKRKSLNTLILEWIGRNKTPQEIKTKVTEYSNILSQMNSMGAKVSTKVEYLTPSYWDEHTVEDFNKSRIQKQKNKLKQLCINNEDDKQSSSPQIKLNNVNKSNNEKITDCNKINYYKYILNIAFDKNQETIDKVNKYITTYLNYLNIKCVNQEFSEFENRIEYIYKYEVQCSQESFDYIKSSVEYIIEINNINVALYTKIIRY